MSVFFNSLRLNCFSPFLLYLIIITTHISASTIISHNVSITKTQQSNNLNIFTVHLMSPESLFALNDESKEDIQFFLYATQHIQAADPKKATPAPAAAAEAAQTAKAKEEPKAAAKSSEAAVENKPASAASKAGDDAAEVPKKQEKRNSITLLFKILVRRPSPFSLPLQVYF